MFNVGIIGAFKQPKLVNISDRVMGSSIGFWLESNGVARYDFTTTPSEGIIPGQWYAPGPTTGIGNQYEARWTLLTGAAPFATSFPASNWFRLTQQRGLANFQVGTQVLVEIRRVSDAVVVASATLSR